MLNKFPYPIKHFSFNKLFTYYFGEHDLSSLRDPDLIKKARLPMDNASVNNEFMVILHKFTKYIIPIIGGGGYLRGQPFLKVSTPSWTFADISQAMIKDAIGILIPLTSIFGSNSINVEHPPFSRCFRTINADPGEFVVFDGLISKDPYAHNTTGLTSIAIYFELVPADQHPDGLEGYEPI